MWKLSVFQTISGTEGAPEFLRNMACWVLWQRAAATFISRQGVMSFMIMDKINGVVSKAVESASRYWNSEVGRW